MTCTKEELLFTDLFCFFKIIDTTYWDLVKLTAVAQNRGEVRDN